MRDLNANNITDTVLETFEGCADARYKEIITTVVSTCTPACASSS